MEKYSLSDIAALMNNKNDGLFGGNAAGFIVLILFLLMLTGFGGLGGWGNKGNAINNALTRSDMQQGFDTQSVLRKLDGINNGLCDGFYAVNTNNLQMQNQLQRDLCQGFSATNAAIAENRFSAQQCCCETNRNIDSVKYENAQNTCAIVNAIHEDGEKTRAIMTANTIQALRDKVTEKDQALQTANFQLSQQAQTANIISTLQPVSKPAYLTCSPYQSSFYAYNGLNGGCCGQFA